MLPALGKLRINQPGASPQEDARTSVHAFKDNVTEHHKYLAVEAIKAIRDTPPDGNCFYHAIMELNILSNKLRGFETRFFDGRLIRDQLQVRRMIAIELSENPSLYKSWQADMRLELPQLPQKASYETVLDAYVTLVGSGFKPDGNKFWGGDVETEAAANVFGVKILKWQYDFDTQNYDGGFTVEAQQARERMAKQGIEVFVSKPRKNTGTYADTYLSMYFYPEGRIHLTKEDRATSSVNVKIEQGKPPLLTWFLIREGGTGANWGDSSGHLAAHQSDIFTGGHYKYVDPVQMQVNIEEAKAAMAAGASGSGPSFDLDTGAPPSRAPPSVPKPARPTPTPNPKPPAPSLLPAVPGAPSQRGLQAAAAERRAGKTPAQYQVYRDPATVLPDSSSPMGSASTPIYNPEPETPPGWENMSTTEKIAYVREERQRNTALRNARQAKLQKRGTFK
jgi:hypothetical protein